MCALSRQPFITATTGNIYRKPIHTLITPWSSPLAKIPSDTLCSAFTGQSCAPCCRQVSCKRKAKTIALKRTHFGWRIDAPQLVFLLLDGFGRSSAKAASCRYNAYTSCSAEMVRSETSNGTLCYPYIAKCKNKNRHRGRLSSHANFTLHTPSTKSTPPCTLQAPEAASHVTRVLPFVRVRNVPVRSLPPQRLTCPSTP